MIIENMTDGINIKQRQPKNEFVNQKVNINQDYLFIQKKGTG